MAEYGAVQILFHMEDYHRVYDNCTMYNVEDIPLEMRRHPIMGTVYIILFVIYETSHLLCLPAIWKRMKESSCYKIMFYMSILDITALPVIALGSGIFMYTGLVFCSNPTVLYALSLPSGIWWYTETAAAVLLAFNRCIDLISRHWGERLFAGKKMWIWMFIPTLYGIHRLIFAKTIIFSGNPHVGYLEDTDNTFDSQELAHHNLMVLFLLIALYSTFCARIVRIMKKSMNDDWKKNVKEKKGLFIQVLLISINHLGTAVMYALLVYVPSISTPRMAAVAQLVWISAHGMPGVVYLTMNSSMRKDVKKMLGIREHKVYAAFLSTRVA
ncbi:serpentine type 7TM GPCR chemoreceptor srt domain-containing protein [Ditylenchus destructor]|uniref:Serpentine type 7TM GPCR chemoreceptor srt domain-containing protein n=1 Tax=Ditylenchus destructor TaxID=166010 RepID=A0AAD4MST9_9BILA|nr:serpentine type 7TM GPCR chemoreceptor srt domain-containing protein [Ditylenchus destructor]